MSLGMGMKSGLGKGLQQGGQQILEGVLAKRRLDFEQQRFDRTLAFRNRQLAAQYGWRRGMSDADTATSGVAGGMAKAIGASTPPIATPAAAPTNPSDATRPFRLPGIGRMPGDMNLPRMSPQMGPILPGADLLRRPDEEGYA
jgi:hypothetical protein